MKKFFKLMISLCKNWKVLLTLGTLFGFAYCGSVDNVRFSGTDYTWSASTSENRATGGRVSSSGGSSIGLVSRRADNIDRNIDDNIDVDIDDYLEQAAYFFIRIGRCGQDSQIDAFKTCYNNCVRTSTTIPDFQTCYGTCTTASNTCDFYGSTRGSGFFYDTDKVLTNHHVVEHFLTYTNAGKTYFAISGLVESSQPARQEVASIEWHDEDSDVAMAVLNDDIDGADPVTFGALDDVSLSSPVFTIGNPTIEGDTRRLDLKWQAAQGKIIEFGKGDKDFQIHTSIDIWGGNSGGGLFDLETGKIIGILHSTTWKQIRRTRLSELVTRGTGTHVDKIKELIDNNGGSSRRQTQVNAQSQQIFADLNRTQKQKAYDLIVRDIIEHLDRRD